MSLSTYAWIYGIGFVLTLLGLWVNNQYEMSESGKKSDINLKVALGVSTVWFVLLPTFTVLIACMSFDDLWNKQFLWKPRQHPGKVPGKIRSDGV